jgi:hypothetical protein
MRLWILVAPIVGTCLTAGLPLATYVDKQRHEQQAISTLGRIHEAQERFRAVFGGYATDVATLVRGCDGARGLLPPAVLDDLVRAGYVLELRAAREVTLMDRYCEGRSIASDYYVSAAPRTAWQAASNAFAGRADGQLFVFVDGIPPRESDIAAGLAIPVRALESFRIP